MKKRIKELRKTLGYSQAAFASALAVKPSTVGTWEQVNNNYPPDSVIITLCSLFNVNRQWLETGVGEMFVNVEDDDETIQRKVIGDIFESLPEEKQRLILDSLRSAYERYLDK